ncbi:glycosyltransferase [Sabulibacter ruber]|uniref:glycosyltransferase n=1 Tax=Sabulibacter ruber TaxID=2811901 RepID=UPI001A97AD28|nr:glycosyltransferase [Sabulibacter ruber]
MEYPPFHGGGISTYCHHTVKMLENNGDNVTVIVSDHSLESKIERSKNGATTLIRFNPGNKPYNNYLGYGAALSYEFLEVVNEEIERSGRPDFIEAQDYKGIAYYILNDKKLNRNSYFQNIPIIIVAHAPSYVVLDYDQAPTFKLPDFWSGEMEKWSMTAADILIFPTEYTKNLILPTLNRKDANSHVVLHPFYLENSNIVATNNSKKKLVYLGKLTYTKGIIQLISFFSNLWDQGFDYPLSMIGDDHFYSPRNSSMKDYLSKKYKRHVDSGKLNFEGKLPPLEVKQKIKESDIVIVSSLFETFSYATAEAMALGKVVLISNSGGHSELVSNKISGFVYEQYNFDSFKSSLFEAISLDDQTSSKITHAALKFVEESLNPNKIYQHKTKILKSYTAGDHKTYPFIREISTTTTLIDKPYEKDLLSIVIPYYNSGKYLPDTLNSLNKITYSNCEIIVVNDGSDELESIEVLADLQKKFDFKLISQPNKGLAEARNAGAFFARGEFMAFLDADDLVHPEYYVKAIHVLKNYDNVSFVGAWTQYFEGSEAVWVTFTPEPPYILMHNTLNTSALVYKRNHFLTSGLNDSAMVYGMEDYDSMLSMLEAGFRGVSIPELLFIYRIREDSMSRAFNQINQLYLFRLISKKHKSLFNQYGEEICNFLNANGPSYLYDNPTWEPYTDVPKLWNKIQELSNLLEESTASTLNNEQKDKTKTKSNRKEWKIENLNNEDKAEAIRKWYHKEYEVLPLWYKRFGHVIKVLQGRRSINSILKK